MAESNYKILVVGLGCLDPKISGVLAEKFRKIIKCEVTVRSYYDCINSDVPKSVEFSHAIITGADYFQILRATIWNRIWEKYAKKVILYSISDVPVDVQEKFNILDNLLDVGQVIKNG